MPPYAAVGVGDNLTACQTAIGLWATCDEASGGGDKENTLNSVCKACFGVDVNTC